ncbi:GIY-YIG nuclease family protein [Shewanella sp. LZH-2]|uniref:GIY-YIG nuclease family protein n=1 Tax=Shewanella sp. LZH-2 TaxID=2806008 RepID=UPI00193E8294|nr:GIY-YIG nuclease family protein [Shewanella sp. LZH-2]QRK80160.1 GIY-YIG nuclease family protein [Shewanella sp. LZH-2]
MHVFLTQNLKAFQVKNAKHVIYAHENLKDEVYIGQSRCMVNRWNEHQQIANSKNHPEYEQKFKKALREHKHWRHYIVAIASNQEEADNVESAAIAYYKPSLNSHPGPSKNTKDIYGFVPLNTNGREITMEGKAIKRHMTQERFTDSERKSIRCKVIRKVGKSYVSFECIKDGFRVNIAFEKRAGFKPGDTVLISHTAKGKTFYTTTDHSDVMLV